MAILIDRRDPRPRAGHVRPHRPVPRQEMIEYGTNVVGGVTPGKGGTTVLNRPVFNTVREAVEATGAEASLLFVPPPFAADAMMEAADAGIKTASASPTASRAGHDAVKRFLRRYPREKKMRLIGPNCAGIISPGQGLHGHHAAAYLQPGRVGIVGRSGTLGYEAASQMKALGIGVSSSIGIGGDPINGSSFKDILELFENDPETDAVMMIGEIGGPQEAEAARLWARSHDQAGGAYVAGLSAPKGRKMGHAGAIISAFGESAQEKVDILPEAGIAVAPNPSSMGETVAGPHRGGMGKTDPQLAGMLKRRGRPRPVDRPRHAGRFGAVAAPLALGGLPRIRAAGGPGRGRAPGAGAVPAAARLPAADVGRPDG
jgi:malate-CoA ligase subunit alpha